jgi:hypothetical protein
MKKNLPVTISIAIASFFWFGTALGQANISLSNLALPTSINQALLPNANNIRDLGSSGARWRFLHLDSAIFFKNTRTVHIRGVNNFFAGMNAGNITLTGNGNSALGNLALLRLTSGVYNTAIGYSALTANTTGVSNTAVGHSAIISNTTGSFNTGVGVRALNVNSSGKNNTAIGFLSMYSNTSGFSNSALGFQSLYGNTTGANNTGVGDSALFSNTTGWYNTAVGTMSLSASTIGYYNAAYGYTALFSNSTGNYNSGTGAYSLHDNTAGAFNAAHGFAALYTNNSGSNNTAVGPYALYSNSTGSNNTGLGYFANVAAGDLINATAIGANALADASNQVMLGNGSVTSIRTQNSGANPKYLEFVKTGAPIDWRLEHHSSGRYLFISSSPNFDASGFSDRAYFDTAVVSGYVFHVVGKALASVWQSSDRKLKQDIHELSGALDIVRKLKPKDYLFNTKQYSALNLPTTRQYGLIAQDLEEVLPSLVNTAQIPVRVNEKGEREMEEIKAVNYTELIPVLIKAMQEQQEQIDELKEMLKKGGIVSLSLAGASLASGSPNPAVASTNIQYNAPLGAISKLIITNAAGSLVKTVSLQAGAGRLQLNTAELAAGTYNCSIVTNGKTMSTKQLVVVR